MDSRPQVHYEGIRLSRVVHAFVLLTAVLLITQCQLLAAPTATPTPVWSDEFNGAANSAPDATKWTFDQGNLHVNNEVEIYCPNPLPNPLPKAEMSACVSSDPNAYQDGSGNLVIKAYSNTSTGSVWTSARLKGQGVKTFKYGRIEARMKLPEPKAGIWPAFWALGVNSAGQDQWPDTGEIDFMENVQTAGGLGPNKIASTVHAAAPSSTEPLHHYSRGSGPYTLPSSGVVTDFHIYGAIWSPYMIQFYVDDPSNVFYTVTEADIPADGTWPFNNNIFLIMNLAIGGNWPGPPDSTTPNPALMLVDWVRVYDLEPVPQAAVTVTPFSGPVTWNTTATTQVSLSGTSGKMYLRCEQVPAGSCSLNPAVVDFSANANPTVTLSYRPVPSPALRATHWGGNMKLSLAGGVFLAALSFGLFRRKSYRALAMLSLITVVLLAGMLVACGGGGGGVDPPPSTPTPTATPTPTPATITFKVVGYAVDGSTTEATVTADVQ